MMPIPSRHEDILRARMERKRRRTDIAVTLLAGDPSQVGHWNNRKREIELNTPFALEKIRVAFVLADMILDEEILHETQDTALLRQAQGPQREDPYAEQAYLGGKTEPDPQ